MTTAKNSKIKLANPLEEKVGQEKQKAREIKRASNIIVYINRIHQCLDEAYESLVDREYQSFKDEVESAIEHLEYLRDNGDKIF